uniref:Uncharacterized protein n=1 Tax=Myotis myotis TaxID=51298 RepID=A0A7J8ANF3_MYOMY|nr:hypothetical protein mMyoMyo1_008194 [Myotis myotis]
MGACSSLADSSFPESEGLVLKVPLQPLAGWLCPRPDKQSLFIIPWTREAHLCCSGAPAASASWPGPGAHLSSREEASTVFAETCLQLFFCWSLPYTLPGLTRFFSTCISVSFSRPLRTFQ